MVRHLLLFAVWIGMGMVPVGAAVDVRSGVNRDTITVGDPVVFRLRITRHADDRVWIAPGEDFPRPFEMRQTQPPDIRTLADGRVQETRDFVLSIYALGAVEVPPVAVRYATAGGDSGAIASKPTPVFVRSVIPEGQDDISDVKPPVAIAPEIPMWAYLALAGLLALVALLIYLWRRNRRKPRPDAPPVAVDWEAELNKIAELGLLERGEYKPYYSLLSDVVRRCLEAKAGVRAVEHTTFEIARDLKAAQADGEVARDVERLLSEADLVKFAKFVPQQAAAKEAMLAAARVVQVLVRKPATEAEGISE